MSRQWKTQPTLRCFSQRPVEIRIPVKDSGDVRLRHPVLFTDMVVVPSSCCVYAVSGATRFRMRADTALVSLSHFLSAYVVCPIRTSTPISPFKSAPLFFHYYYYFFFFSDAAGALISLESGPFSGHGLKQRFADYTGAGRRWIQIKPAVLSWQLLLCYIIDEDAQWGQDAQGWA